jgi:molecular chaperone DnaK (HSP70)
MQKEINLNIFTGEHQIADMNRLLACVKITGIPPQPKGEAKVSVNFRVDDNGLLSLRAKPLQLPGKNEVSAVICAKEMFTDRDEVERACQIARQHQLAAADLTTKIDLRTKFESGLLEV